MPLNSSDVNAGDDILSQHHNFLIDDIEQHTHEGTDTTKVKVENIDVSTGDLGADSVPATALKINAVIEAKINSGAVTVNKLGTSAVTTVKINGSAVTEAKINNGAVTVNKLGTNAVTTIKINNNAVDENKLDETKEYAMVSLATTGVNGLKLHNTYGGGYYWHITREVSGFSLYFYYNTTLRYTFDEFGTGKADLAWSTFSPDIRKDDEFKNKEILEPIDYLNWSLKDATKPIKPYEGIPRLKKDTNDNHPSAFDTKELVDKEDAKYSKDIGKISIGVAYWAKEAENRIKQLEDEVIALKDIIDKL